MAESHREAPDTEIRAMLAEIGELADQLRRLTQGVGAILDGREGRPEFVLAMRRLVAAANDKAAGDRTQLWQELARWASGTRMVDELDAGMPPDSGVS